MHSCTSCPLQAESEVGVTATPDPKDRPIVDPQEVQRHDDQFNKDNPDWDKQYGGKR